MTSAYLSRPCRELADVLDSLGLDIETFRPKPETVTDALTACEKGGLHRCIRPSAAIPVAEVCGCAPESCLNDPDKLIDRAASALYHANNVGQFMADYYCGEARKWLLRAAADLPPDLAERARQLALRCAWNFAWPLYGQVVDLCHEVAALNSACARAVSV